MKSDVDKALKGISYSSASRRVCFKARSMAYRASIGDPSEISEVAVVIWFIR